MNTFKTFLALAALAASAYAVYVAIYTRPEGGRGEFGPVAAATSDALPMVELGPPDGGGLLPVPHSVVSQPPLASERLTVPATSEAAAPPTTAYGPSSEYAPETAVPATDPTTAFRQAMNESRDLLEQGRLADALRLLSPHYDWAAPPVMPAEDYDTLVNLLDQLAGTVIYSRQNWLERAYEIQSGDDLEIIATKYRVPWQLMAKINGVADPRGLQPNERIKVVPGPFDAVVDVTRFRLTLSLNGMYAGRFRIGTGADLAAAQGEFTVLDKIEYPQYNGADGTIPSRDPRNPLGSRWIDLGDGVGIHGTAEPDSIGQAAARGCVLLASPDIEDLYDILSVGSKVSILSETRPPAPSPVADRSGPRPGYER